MQRGAFCKRVPSPLCAFPPLRETRHCRIMERHFVLQTPNTPAGSTQTEAQFRFFTGNQVGPKTADLLESVDADQRNASAGLRLADRGIPFDVAKHVVDR